MKNPNWNRDETILALDLYFREPGTVGRSDHQKVIELSKYLNSLPIHPIESRTASFRNPDGVAMKLSNLRSVDPNIQLKGSDHKSSLDVELMLRFSSDKGSLHALANAIRENSAQLEPPITEESDDSGEEAEEGRVLTRIHHQRERNRNIVKKKKESVLKINGDLKCEVCTFDFKTFYGVQGEGFAECHHKTPLHKINPGEKTKLGDLAILCANCHRMLHRRRPWLSIDALKQLINQQ
jgi:5-methylcytosine-specific restriction protein A